MAAAVCVLEPGCETVGRGAGGRPHRVSDVLGGLLGAEPVLVPEARRDGARGAAEGEVGALCKYRPCSTSRRWRAALRSAIRELCD